MHIILHTQKSTSWQNSRRTVSKFDQKKSGERWKCIIELSPGGPIAAVGRELQGILMENHPQL